MIPADQKRAVSDLSCACRKLAAMCERWKDDKRGKYPFRALLYELQTMPQQVRDAMREVQYLIDLDNESKGGK